MFIFFIIVIGGKKLVWLCWWISVEVVKVLFFDDMYNVVCFVNWWYFLVNFLNKLIFIFGAVKIICLKVILVIVWIWEIIFWIVLSKFWFFILWVIIWIFLMFVFLVRLSKNFVMYFLLVLIFVLFIGYVDNFFWDG